MRRLMGRTLYPLDRPKAVKRSKTSVRVSEQEKADLQAIAKIWGQMDETLGIGETDGWSPTTVMEQLIRSGIDDAWEQMGGRPPTDDLREEFVRKAIANIQKHAKQK